MSQKRIVDGDRLLITDENGSALLSIRETLDEPVMTLKLTGSITMNLAHEFEDELTSVITVCSRVIIDFSNLESISSAGLKALLSAQQILDKRPNSMLKLQSLSVPVQKMFQDMGFIELFDIEN